MNVDAHIIGDFIGVLGEILVGWTAIAVHHRFRHEHKIDEKVFKVMRQENILGYAGIGLILIGFIIRMAVN